MGYSKIPKENQQCILHLTYVDLFIMKLRGYIDLFITKYVRSSTIGLHLGDLKRG